MALALSKGLRTALYALVTLGLLGSWLIALSGVSALQKICHTPGFGGCRQQLGLQWWVIWFEFVTILITLAVQFSPALSGGKTCIIAFLAILTTLEMILANQALDLRDDSGRSTIDDSTGSYYINTNRANTATAGWILLSIFNLLLIAAMSTHPEHHDDDDLNATSGKHGPPPAASHPMRPMSSRGGQSLGGPPGNSYRTNPLSWGARPEF